MSRRPPSRGTNALPDADSARQTLEMTMVPTLPSEYMMARMYTKLAMIEEALKKKRQAEDKKPGTTAVSDNQHDAGARGF
jgi:hypothetical protein